MDASSPPLLITWLGHATTIIELDGVRILTDPVLRDRVGPLVRHGPGPRARAIGLVDCVLLSHLHADHTDIASLREIDCPGPILAPRPAGEWLTGKGLRRVRELATGTDVGVGGLRVAAVPACHDRRRRPLGPAADPIGYLVAGSKSVYFAGDTDIFPAMAELRGLVDVALLPVGGWGPRLPPGHLNPESAAAAAALIAPAVAIPIHWGTFTIGLSRGRSASDRRPALDFAAMTERRAPTVEVRVLELGETTAIGLDHPDRLTPLRPDRETSDGW